MVEVALYEPAAPTGVFVEAFPEGPNGTPLSAVVVFPATVHEQIVVLRQSDVVQGASHVAGLIAAVAVGQRELPPFVFEHIADQRSQEFAEPGLLLPKRARQLVATRIQLPPVES